MHNFDPFFVVFCDFRPKLTNSKNFYFVNNSLPTNVYGPETHANFGGRNSASWHLPSGPQHVHRKRSFDSAVTPPVANKSGAASVLASRLSYWVRASCVIRPPPSELFPSAPSNPIDAHPPSLQTHPMSSHWLNPDQTHIGPDNC